MSHLTHLLICAGLCLVSCSQAPIARDNPVDMDGFIQLFERSFQTSPDNKESIIFDKRVGVKSEVLKGYWFYTQLNTGEARKLYRQRLSQMKLSDDGTAIIQITYGLNEPETYVDSWTRLDLLKSLSADDFKPYFQKGCEQIWRPDERGGWAGYVDPETCIITSKRRNKDIRIESEAYLSRDVYRTNERGYEMDMRFLWGTKLGEYIELFPVP